MSVLKAFGSVTMIDCDDDLLTKVAKELGTVTKKDTVHAAPRVLLHQSATRNLRAMMAGDPDGLAHETTVNAMWKNGDEAQIA